MKKIIPFLLLLLTMHTTYAQILNKLKKKAEDAVSKPSDKTASNGTASEAPKETASTEPEKNNPSAQVNTNAATDSGADESDFIPGNTVLYFDNFEKEKDGDLPAGWITSTSAEVKGLTGLKGKWLKMFSTSTLQFTRSKKQSWGTQFTVEFDLVIVKEDYDPRISFVLINTKGNLVTDEKILQNKYFSAYVSTILGENGKKTRLSLCKNDDINRPVSDLMSAELLYTNYVPVHVSMTVQDKRFRFWWNGKKLYDAAIINPQFMPNQFGFDFGPVGGSDFYVTNIRIAKDIPATKSARLNDATVNTDQPVADPATGNNPVVSPAAPAIVKLQSKVLNIELPFAQIMKTGDATYTFSAGKEEGNYKENFFKIFLSTPGYALKAEAFNFQENNQKNPLYGTKKFPEITKTEAILFYGNVKKPYIYKFVPRIANAHYASFVSADLDRNLPPASPNCKLVFEKIENGLASGYFIFGMMNQGLKPITKGDAMTETFTDGFIGELKCTFSNVPVY